LGADATLVDSSGNSALHLAILADDEDINKQKHAAQRVLSLDAMEAARIRIICSLVGAGGSLSAQNNMQMTPLSVARQGSALIRFIAHYCSARLLCPEGHPAGWSITNRFGQADIRDLHLFDFQLVASDYTDCLLRYTVSVLF